MEEEASELKKEAELVLQHSKSRQQKTGSKTPKRDDETPESEDEILEDETPESEDETPESEDETLEGDEETAQMDEEEECPLRIDEEVLKIVRRWEAFEREADKQDAKYKEQVEERFKLFESHREVLAESLEATRECVKLLKERQARRKSSTWLTSRETIDSEPDYEIGCEVWDPVLHQLALDIEFDFKAFHLLPLFGPDDYDEFELFPYVDAEEIAEFNYIDYLNDTAELRERVSKDCFNGVANALVDFEVTMHLLKTSKQSRPDLLKFIRVGEDNRIGQLEALIDGATSDDPNITFSLEKKELAKQRARQIYTTPSVTMKSVKAKQIKDVNSKLLSSSA